MRGILLFKVRFWRIGFGVFKYLFKPFVELEVLWQNPHRSKRYWAWFGPFSMFLEV